MFGNNVTGSQGNFGSYGDEESRLLALAMQESLQDVEGESTVDASEADLQEVLAQLYHAPQPPQVLQAPDPELAEALKLSLEKPPSAAPARDLGDSDFDNVDPDDLDLQAILALSFPTQPSAQPAPLPLAGRPVVRHPTQPSAQPAPAPRPEQEKTDTELLEEALRLSLLTAPRTAAPIHRPGPAPRPAHFIEADLFKTTLASSTVSDESLSLAVENAKKNPKLRIASYQLGLNQVGNRFLILNFTSGIQRTMAIEELRSKYGMFQKSEPNRMGEIKLKLTVEQSIEFQNKF